MKREVLLMAAELASRGEAFALATVVRRGAPTSSHVGDSAVITASGVVHGWLGGSCTEPVVVREARAALAAGTPRLIALSPDPEAARRPGVAVFPMTCHSGGTVEIYIEPMPTAARLVVFGGSPVAVSLARLGTDMGFAVDIIDPDADRAAFSMADRVLTTLDGAALARQSGLRGSHVYAVVATMGQRDDEALAAALALEPSYIGVVASRKRFAELREALSVDDAATSALAGVKAPAGLDLGGERPEEIALSILAEITQRRHSARKSAAEQTSSSESATPAASDTAIDPVCGMTVDVATAKHTAEVSGRMYYFCCSGCRTKFLAAPDRFLAAEGAR